MGVLISRILISRKARLVGLWSEGYGIKDPLRR